MEDMINLLLMEFLPTSEIKLISEYLFFLNPLRVYIRLY